MMSSRVFPGIAAVLGAVALAGGIVSPASAGPAASPRSLAQCPAGSVCLWVDGPFLNAPTSYGAPAYEDVNAYDHDRVSSWANKTNFTYCLFDYEGSGGTDPVAIDVLAPWHSREILSASQNDRADAIGRCG